MEGMGFEPIPCIHGFIRKYRVTDLKKVISKKNKFFHKNSNFRQYFLLHSTLVILTSIIYLCLLFVVIRWIKVNEL